MGKSTPRRRKGLIRKRTLGSDRRAELVEVTPAGLAYVRKYEKVKAERIVTLLGDADVAALSDHLETIIEILLREREITENLCLGCGAYYAKGCVVQEKGLSPRCTH